MADSMHTPQMSSTHHDGSHVKTIPLAFPLRELAVGAFEAYRASPLGLKLSGKFWREIGVESTTSLRDSSLRDAVGRGLLLEPCCVWGISIGYLPGPESFRLPSIRGGLTDLPDAPSSDEIRNHAKVRILMTIVDALEKSSGRSAPETRIRHAFNLQAGEEGAIISALLLDRLVERIGSELIPTPTMLARIGREHSVQALIPPQEEGVQAPRLHHWRATQREALYEQVKPRLQELLQRRPGLTPTEVFYELEKLPVWPPQASKEVCIGFLDRSVREGHIERRHKDRGPGWLYFLAWRRDGIREGGTHTS